MSERNCNKCIHHTSGMCDSWDCKMQTVEDVKKEAVNEYAKVVVEELETDSSVKLYGSRNSGNYMIPVDRAIRIVKHGGVSDDVCEWKLTDTKKLMPYKTSCGNEDMYDIHYKYCPYCSKKIKAVE